MVVVSLLALENNPTITPCKRVCTIPTVEVTDFVGSTASWRRSFRASEVEVII